jgi:hypothetical protein
VKLHFFEEPELEFGQGTHICPRAGISQYDVYDTRFKARRDKIYVGAVGTSDTLAKLDSWLDKCSMIIPAKPGRLSHLFAAFCGFNREAGFRANLVLEEEITRWLDNSDLRRIIKKVKGRENKINEAVEMYYRQVKFLTQHRVVDVVVCIIPNDLYDVIGKEEISQVEETIDDESEDDILETNFRRALKAKAMHLGKPLQLLKEVTLESDKRQQDEATKAWNFCTALYYKANQTVPWKLISNVNRPAVCYAGIGFYRSRDRKVLHTSLAQVFDELGNSVILRGTPVDVNKDDRRPHLTEEQAYDLLRQALYEYEIALGNAPGRLVIHKSSNYNAAELAGLQAAAGEVRIKALDFVTILDTDTRLLRAGIYPPYRGTDVELDKDTHLLYTRGFVKYYGTYPGLYVPQSLEVRIVESDESPIVICQEILNLTKMNWNNTQFDGKYPITIQCARKVGQIMKYLGPEDKPQISYCFYM